MWYVTIITGIFAVIWFALSIVSARSAPQEAAAAAQALALAGIPYIIARAADALDERKRRREAAED